jgi:hypothetical protein
MKVRITLTFPARIVIVLAENRTGLLLEYSLEVLVLEPVRFVALIRFYKANCKFRYFVEAGLAELYRARISAAVLSLLPRIRLTQVRFGC